MADFCKSIRSGVSLGTVSWQTPAAGRACGEDLHSDIPASFPYGQLWTRVQLRGIPPLKPSYPLADLHSQVISRMFQLSSGIRRFDRRSEGIGSHRRRHVAL